MVEELLEKAFEFNNTDVDSALVYSGKAYDLARKTTDVQLTARATNAYSYFLILSDRITESLSVLDYNLSHAAELSPQVNGEAHYNLASGYYLNEVYDKAIEQYLKAIEYYEISGERKGIAKANLQVGVIYDKLGKSELASYFYDRSMANSEQAMSSHSSDTIGEYMPSESLVKISAAMLREVGEEPSITRSFVLYNLGNSNYKLGRCQESINYLLKSIAIKNEVGYRLNVAKSYLLMADCSIRLNDPAAALDYLAKARQNPDERRQVMDIERLSAEAYAAAGNTDAALHAYKRYSRLKDSVAQLQENERIAEITAQFETEKQAKEIELLTADNQLKEVKLGNQRLVLFGSILLMCLAALAAYLAYKRVRTKRELAFSEVNRQLLQTQLNPHFLFNALNGIQHYISKEQSTKASGYIRNFTSLMRNILENTTEEFISIREDIETIEDYLALQQLVHGERFSFELVVGDEVDQDGLCIPPMFTQPFVENAVIHGVKELEAGEIRIEYALNADLVTVSIRDNGQGFSPTGSTPNQLHRSMATNITRNRIDYLSKSRKYPVKIDIIGRRPGEELSGATVTISFPKKSCP